MNRLFVFYHIGIVGKWEERFALFLRKLLKSGLYHNMEKAQLVVIYQDKSELKKLEQKISSYKRIEIFYKRRLDKNPFSFDPGESEGILKMVGFAKENAGKYLFTHAKSVTDKWKGRGNKDLNNLLDYMFNRNEDHPFYRSVGELDHYTVHMEFLEEVHNEVIMDWDEYIRLLDHKNYGHWFANFFWVRSSLLQKFEMGDYCRNVGSVRFPHTDKQCNATKGGDPTGRHFTALFAYKMDRLYGNSEDLFIKDRAYKHSSYE